MNPRNEVNAQAAIEQAVASGADQLDLHGLGLKVLPPLPAALLGLRRLDLSGNRLSALPPQVLALAQLELLDLGANRLVALDPGIARLEALRELDLSENRLTDLPEALSALRRLARLDLFGNRLTVWPAAVLALPVLASLDLAGNRIDTLPALEGQLTALQRLDLSGNRLASIDGLAALPALRDLRVDGNPIASLPDALRGRLPGFAPEGHRPAVSPTPGPRLRELVQGGQEPGQRYLQAPQYRMDFVLELADAPALGASLDLYYKGFAGTPARLVLDSGTRVDLPRIGRKAAWALAATSSGGLLEFQPTRDDATVQAACAFGDRVLDRVTGAALRAFGPSQAAVIDTQDAAPLPADLKADVGVLGTPVAIDLAEPAAAVEAPAEPEALDGVLSAGHPQRPPWRDALPVADRSATGPAAAPSLPEAEPVDTAVFCPPTVARTSSFLIQVFLYPPAAAAAVAAQAREADEAAERRGTYALPDWLPRNTRVDLHLEMPGLTVAEPDAVLVWQGQPTVAQFEAEVPAQAALAPTLGRIRFAIAGVPAGTLRFQTRVVESGSMAEAGEAQALRARRYRRAFVSYSSKDRAEVLRRVQAFRIAGISVFQDILDLDPGERWEKALYREIDHCDVFLLFWSKSAADSPWVGKEIEYAVARKGGEDERPPDIQPVPIEGPPIPDPPPGLGGLHFNDALLAHIAVASKAPPERPAAGAS